MENGRFITNLSLWLWANNSAGLFILADLAKYQDYGFLRQIPALVFHGINDVTIPYRVSQRYVDDNAAAIFHQLDSNHSLEDKQLISGNIQQILLERFQGNQNLI